MLVKRVGISLLHLRGTVGRQGEPLSDPSVIESPDPPRRAPPRPAVAAERAAALERALDGLRARHGFGKVLRGASLPLLKEHFRPDAEAAHAVPQPVNACGPGLTRSPGPRRKLTERDDGQESERA